MNCVPRVKKRCLSVSAYERLRDSSSVFSHGDKLGLGTVGRELTLWCELEFPF